MRKCMKMLLLATGSYKSFRICFSMSRCCFRFKPVKGTLEFWEATLPETNSLFLKIDGWKTFSFPFGARPIFRGKMLVSGRVIHVILLQ